MPIKKIISFRPPNISDAVILNNLIHQLGYPISLEDTKSIIEDYSTQNNHFAYLEPV